MNEWHKPRLLLEAATVASCRDEFEAKRKWTTTEIINFLCFKKFTSSLVHPTLPLFLTCYQVEILSLVQTLTCLCKPMLMFLHHLFTTCMRNIFLFTMPLRADSLVYFLQQRPLLTSHAIESPYGWQWQVCLWFVCKSYMQVLHTSFACCTLHVACFACCMHITSNIGDSHIITIINKTL